MSSSEEEPPPKEIDKRLLNLHEKEIGCNVTISVTLKDCPVESIYVHKERLVSQSQVFTEMWSGNQGPEDEVTVEISDMPMSAVKDMISFIYMDEVTITDDNLVNLTVLAQRYKLAKLYATCEAYMKENLSGSAACALLDHAIKLPEMKNIQEMCYNYIILHILDISRKNSTVGFWDLSDNAFEMILSDDRLCVVTEEEVLDMCLEWAERKLAKAGIIEYTGQKARETLGPVFYQVRFASMTPEVFCAVRAKSLLTEEEKVLHFACLANLASDSEINQVKKMGFNLKRRFNRSRHLNRFMFLSSTCSFKPEGEERFYVVPSRRIQFAGISVVRGVPGTLLEVSVRVLDCPKRRKKKEVCKYTAEVMSPRGHLMDFVPVYAKSFVEMKKDRKYKIMVTVKTKPKELTGFGEFTGYTDTYVPITVAGVDFKLVNRDNDKFKAVGCCPGIIFFRLKE